MTADREQEWVETAFLPREKYRVVETDDGWIIFTPEDHGAFS